MADCDKCDGEHVTAYGYPSCVAHKRGQGIPCRNSPVRGGTVCRNHGGATPSVVRASRRRYVEQARRGEISQLLRDVEAPNLHPLDGLLEAVRRSGSVMRALGVLVEELDVQPDYEPYVTPLGEEAWRPKSLLGHDHQGDQAANVLIKLYGEWLDRHAKACKLALEAGVEERQVRVAERQAELLASVINGVLGDLDLTPEQAERAPTIVRQRLATLPEGGEVA